MAFFKRIFFFVLVNILIITTINIVLSVFNLYPRMSAYGIDYQSLAIFCLIWGMTGSLISLAISRLMAKWMMGVRVIDPNSSQGDEQRLVTIVYDLARRAGLPKMPEVGIYERPEINAFATGPTKSRALVAVSRGLLNSMNSDQIEGVLGHEISHVANGDMVTMTLLQGVVNAFVMFLARVIAFFISQNAKEENRRMIQMFVTIGLEILLSLLGAMVVMAFSRWREFRADAGGATLAGKTKMIAALEGLRRLTQYAGDDRSSVATLKISSRRGLFKLLSSHPDLEERIERLQRSAAQ